LSEVSLHGSREEETRDPWRWTMMTTTRTRRDAVRPVSSLEGLQTPGTRALDELRAFCMACVARASASSVLQ
jgi:hypothetical protein